MNPSLCCKLNTLSWQFSLPHHEQCFNFPLNFPLIIMKYLFICHFLFGCQTKIWQSVLGPYLCLELVGHGCDCSGDQSGNLVIWMMEFQGQEAVFGNILFTGKDVVPRTAPGLQHHLKHLQNQGKWYSLHGLYTKYVFLWKLFTERKMRQLILFQLMRNIRKNMVRQ